MGERHEKQGHGGRRKKRVKTFKRKSDNRVKSGTEGENGRRAKGKKGQRKNERNKQRGSEGRLSIKNLSA